MHTGLFVKGSWVETEHRLDVLNKYNQESLGSVFVADEATIEAALCSAQSGAKAIAKLPLYRRADILRKVAVAIGERQEQLAQLIALEAGKPLRLARAEVERAVSTFRFASEECSRSHGETIPFDATPTGEGYVGYWWRRPLGTIAAITPFNFPLNLVAHKVAPAIATGNAFLLKPAEQTPLTAVALFEILLECGLPPESGQLLQGEGWVGAALVRDARIQKVSFTGSVSVGKSILQNAGIKRVTLELGNSSPVLIASDADLTWAASRCALGAFAFAGQTCISVQRIYCTERRFDEFVHLMIQAAQKLQLGDPLLESTDIGPMISVADACRIDKLIHQELAQGAKRLIGGDRNGSCVPATIVTGVSDASPLVQQEAFAPVVVVVPCKNFDDCIEHANQTEYGLQVGIFTRDIDRILSSIPQLDFGGVVINDMPGFRADHMPYGGVKQSGIGREGVRFAMEEMTSIQTVAIRRRESSPEKG